MKKFDLKDIDLKDMPPKSQDCPITENDYWNVP